jgi:hypothetical protein
LPRLDRACRMLRCWVESLHRVAHCSVT